MRLLFRKITAYVAIVAMLCSLSITGYAGTDKMTVELSGGQLKNGEEIVVPVAVKNNVGIGAADLQIIYDSKNLEIEQITADYSDIDSTEIKYGGFFGGITPNPAEGIVAWASANPYEKNSELFWIVFKTKDEALNGSYSVSLTHTAEITDNMFSNNGVPIEDDTISVIPAEIIITGAGDPVATSVEISGGQNTVAVPDKATGSVTTAVFAATVKNQQGSVMSDADVVWSLEDKSGNEPEGISIGEDGVVTVTNKASAGTITVKASSGDAEGTASLELTKEISEAMEVQILKDGVPASAEDTLTIPASGENQAEFAAAVYDQYGGEMTEQSVTWSMEPRTLEGVSFETQGNKVKVSVKPEASNNSGFELKAAVGGISDNVNISLKSIEITWPSVVTNNPVYGYSWNELISLKNDGKAELNGSEISGNFEVKNPSEVPDAGVQNYTIVFNSDDGQYSVEKTESLEIQKKTAELEWSGNLNLTYDGTSKNVTAAVSNLVGDDTCNVTVTGGAEINAGNYTAIATDLNNANYKLPEAAVMQYTIDRADYSVKLSQEEVSVKAGTSDLDFLPSASTEGVSDEKPEGILKFYTDTDRETELTADAVSNMSVGTYKLYWGFVTSDANYISDMKKGEITLKITEGDPQNIEIQDAGEKVYGDAPFKLNAVVTTTGNSPVTDGGKLNWESSDEKIASVDESGNVTIHSAGTAVLSVKAEAVPGKYAAGSKTYELTVSKRPVTISGIKAEDKVYDGTTDAEVDCTEATINGMIAGDELSVTAEGGTFENAAAGSDKTVTLNGISLSGSSNENYMLADEGQQTTATADILKNENPALVLGNLDQREGSVKAVTAELSPYDPEAVLNIYYGSEQEEKTEEVVSQLPEGVEAEVPVVTTDEKTDPVSGFVVEEKTVITYHEVKNDETGETTYKMEKVVASLVFTEELPSEAGTYTVVAVFNGNDNIASVSETGTLTITKKSSGSSSGGGSAAVSYMIAAEAGEGGTISPESVQVKSGEDQTFTITPNEGYVIADVLADGKSVGAINSYTFENVRSTHTIKAVFEKDAEVITPESFADIAGHWAEDSIHKVVDAGLMNGTGEGVFSPDGKMTRAMLVTIFWRMEGEPEAETSSFEDVESDSWYEEAVNWANSQGIVTGFSDTEFGPDKAITREQIAVILYRYQLYKGNSADKRADLSHYEDYGKISPYAQEAMSWANAEGLITGRTSTTLNPDGIATRAEIATLLVRNGI